MDSGPISPSLRSPLSSRCTQCSARQKENARNLVVCIDGTSNEFGQNNTNVIKLYAKVDQETENPKQIPYYSSGIGTGPRSSSILNRVGRAVIDKVDMAVAWNKGDTVKETYAWLAKTYQEGDQIYLFGFSRGAYQVRVLAAMIYEVGLIKEPTEKQIGKAYDFYEAIYTGGVDKREIARTFKNTFSRKGVRVHFVGVWDTVSSVGVIRGDVFLSASSTASHACHFRHALALDELRVKFMPEYFHEVNSQTDDGKSKYIATSPDVECATSPTSERLGSIMSDSETGLSGEKRTTDIKEVWFPGSHSDVGGTDRPGKPYHAGKVSLLWMRREAAASGLVLKPADSVWVPDDIDLGISDSMTAAWRAVEYIPIKHQVSFGGSGDDARRVHRLQPRRIIPGQKVHASVLYANTYKPQASPGEGLYIPIVHGELGTELDDGVWETALFDETAAQELMARLGEKQIESARLDELLFMLRTKEGRQCIRNVPNWQSRFVNFIHNRDGAPIVRLVATVAYYEAFSDADDGSAPELSQDIFDNAKKFLNAILAGRKHQDDPRLIALIRPLTKHKVLRDHILTQDIFVMIIGLLDVIISQSGEIFGLAMDALDCLLQCEDTQKIIIEKLGANVPYSKASRLSRILDINDPRLLATALRVVSTLVRIREARPVCLMVKPRIMELARKEDQLVGLPAVDIYLSLFDPNDREQLNIRDARIRINLAGALVRLDTERRDSVNVQGRGADTGQLVLRQLFGLDATELSEAQKNLIKELKKVVPKISIRERTGATFTLLKLCETEIIRTFLREIDLLGVFISQLRRRDSALLAAHALATCLKYCDMKESIKDNEQLAKNIVNMLRLDYFDDAIGQVEGFQIFGAFMQHADLRAKIKNHNIIEVLDAKLAKCNPKETRTSLICLDIIRTFDQDGQREPQSPETLRGVREDENAKGNGNTEKRPTIDLPKMIDLPKINLASTLIDSIKNIYS